MFNAEFKAISTCEEMTGGPSAILDVKYDNVRSPKVLLSVRAFQYTFMFGQKLDTVLTTDTRHSSRYGAVKSFVLHAHSHQQLRRAQSRVSFVHNRCKGVLSLQLIFSCCYTLVCYVLKSRQYNNLFVSMTSRLFLRARLSMQRLQSGVGSIDRIAGLCEHTPIWLHHHSI